MFQDLCIIPPGSDKNVNKKTTKKTHIWGKVRKNSWTLLLSGSPPEVNRVLFWAQIQILWEYAQWFFRVTKTQTTNSDKPTKQTNRQTNTHTTNQPNNQQTNPPENQPTKQTYNQPNKQLTSKPNKQTDKQTNIQPTNQTTRKPENQTNNQTTNQWYSFLFVLKTVSLCVWMEPGSSEQSAGCQCWNAACSCCCGDDATQLRSDVDETSTGCLSCGEFLSPPVFHLFVQSVLL